MKPLGTLALMFALALAGAPPLVPYQAVAFGGHQLAAGHFAAHSSAASRSGASTR